MKYTIFSFSSFWCRGKARCWVPPLNTQCIRNSIWKWGAESVNTRLTLSNLPNAKLKSARKDAVMGSIGFTLGNIVVIKIIFVEFWQNTTEIFFVLKKKWFWLILNLTWYHVDFHTHKRTQFGCQYSSATIDAVNCLSFCGSAVFGYRNVGQEIYIML